MTRRISEVCLLAVMLWSILASAVLAKDIRLIENDRTDYRIVVARGSSATDNLAASELQGYLMQMSNVFLPMDRRNTLWWAQRLLPVWALSFRSRTQTSL